MTYPFNSLRCGLTSYTNKILLSTVLALPCVVLAAGNATVEMDGNTASIQWLDTKTARFDSPDEDSYLISKNNKLYVVNMDDGAPMVMELSGFAQMAMNFADNDAIDKLIPEAITNVKATGKKEEHAGIKGEVYILTIKDSDGEKDEIEVVLTDNKISNELTDLYINLMENLVGAKNFQNSLDQLPKNKRGILRLDNEFTVTSLSNKGPDKEALELPAEPLSMQNLMQDLQKMMQSLGDD